MSILFNVPEAKKFLEENEFVYTIRPNTRPTGRAVAIVGNPYNPKETLGTVFVTKVSDDTTPETLAKYVKFSGFDSVEAWLGAADKYGKGKPKALYWVQFVK